jgi:hypothetical protein
MASTSSSRPAGWVVVLFLLSGCSSLAVRGPVDASAYASMDCNELNETLAKMATSISQTAITRGKVARTNIPNWVPGGTRVATAVTDRQTAKIERLQGQERAVVSARDKACARR